MRPTLWTQRLPCTFEPWTITRTSLGYSGEGQNWYSAGHEVTNKVNCCNCFCTNDPPPPSLSFAFLPPSSSFSLFLFFSLLLPPSIFPLLLFFSLLPHSSLLLPPPPSFSLPLPLLPPPPSFSLPPLSSRFSLTRHIGDEWLVTNEDTESYIPDVTEVGCIE